MKNLALIKSIINKGGSLSVIDKTVLINGNTTTFFLEGMESFATVKERLFNEDGIYDVFSKVKLQADTNEFPIKTEGEKVQVIVLTPDDLIKLTQVAEACSKSKLELRPVMKGVCIDKEGIAAGTDANMLLTQTLSKPNQDVFTDNSERGIIIPEKSLLKGLKLFANTDVTVSLIGDKWVELSSDNVSVYIRVIDAVYPNWRAIVPDYRDCHTTFEFTPDMLKPIIAETNDIRKSTNEIAETVFIKVDTETQKAVYENIGFEIQREWDAKAYPSKIKATDVGYGVIMPTISDNGKVFADHVCGLNIMLLARLLKSYKQGFKLHMHKNNRALLIEPIETNTKPTKTKIEKPQKVTVETHEDVETPDAPNVQIIDYSEKSIAIIGQTYDLAHLLKEVGVFNKHLNINGKRKWGWVVSKKKIEQLTQLLTNEVGS